jgi:hypothetical protein
LTASVPEVPRAELTTSRSSGWRRALPWVAAVTAVLVTPNANPTVYACRQCSYGEETNANAKPASPPSLDL